MPQRQIRTTHSLQILDVRRLQQVIFTGRRVLISRRQLHNNKDARCVVKPRSTESHRLESGSGLGYLAGYKGVGILNIDRVDRGWNSSSNRSELSMRTCIESWDFQRRESQPVCRLLWLIPFLTAFKPHFIATLIGTSSVWKYALR